MPRGYPGPAPFLPGLLPLLGVAVGVGVFCYVGGVLWWLGWALATLLLYGISRYSPYAVLFGLSTTGLGALLVLHGLAVFPIPAFLALLGWLLSLAKYRHRPRRLGPARAAPPGFRPQHREVYVAEEPESRPRSRRFHMG